MKKQILFLSFVLVLGACSAKTEVDGDLTPEAGPNPTPTVTEVKPTLACQSDVAVNGKIDGKPWALKSGVAFLSGFEGMWDVTLYNETLNNPCKEFGSARGISLRVPQVVGDFNLENEKAAFFYDMTVTPNISKSTSNGRLHITEITGQVIRGSFEGYVDEATGACGKFEITRCQ